MGTRELCDFDPGDDFAPGDFISAPRSRDVFKSPQGCSGTPPVGKDEGSRSVGKDDFDSGDLRVARAPLDC